jgi:hypothetical protein
VGCGERVTNGHQRHGKQNRNLCRHYGVPNIMYLHSAMQEKKNLRT